MTDTGKSGRHGLRERLGIALNNEKVRFLIVGAWNSGFGWLSFAALWWLLGEHTNLWVVSVLAHGIATTQSFLSQRHLVFRATQMPWWRQYIRFQWAYLMLLGLGSFALNALAVQGMHPLLAQTLVFAVLAAGSFLLGKNFVYAATQWKLSILLRGIAQTTTRHALAIASFLVSLVLFEAFWGAPYYATDGRVGADFDLTSVHLLEGKFWIDSNGWISALFNPPWFTPAWCGGTAFYADPQSAFYSPLQVFAYFSNSFAAVHWNSLLFAAVAFWGSYALARAVLRWSPAASVMFGVLGTVNGFLPEHSLYGQAGYQPLYLWTFIVLGLCWPGKACLPGLSQRRALLWPSVTVGLMLTGWLQFGFGGMLIPASFAVLLLCLALVAVGKADLRAILERGALGSLIALCLNASKIYESLSLLRNFPRDFYAMFGLATPHEAVVATLRALTQPTGWSAWASSRAVSPMAINSVHPDWAFQFGLGALAIAACALAARLAALRRQSTGPRAQLDNTFAWLALGSVVFACATPPAAAVAPGIAGFIAEMAASSLPVLVMVAALGGMALLRAPAWRDAWARTDGTQRWLRTGIWLLIAAIAALPLVLLHASEFRELVKRLPILNTTTWSMRWVVVYVPIAQLLLAWPVERLMQRLPEGWQSRATFAALALVWLGPALAPMGYYVHPWVKSYKAEGMAHAFNETRRTGEIIPINAIYLNWYRWMYVGRNDSMLVGLSQGLCYNPIYGYLLEGFPQLEWMEQGPALQTNLRGQSLLRDPACLVHPEQNACKPGDGFTLAQPQQRTRANQLLERKPLDWERPPVGSVLSLLSQTTFWLLLTALTLRLWRAVLHQPPQVGTPPVEIAAPPASPSPSKPLDPSTTLNVIRPTPRGLIWTVFLLSMAAFEWIWGGRYYRSLTNVGHDFALTTTGLMEGRNWLASNGWFAGLLDPPWFTPAWCAGTAFYADPQSAFYSTLQLFAWWVDPFQATHLNSLLFAALAFWGSFLLARRAFGWDGAAAAFFGVLGMCNSFLPWRSAVGEAGYQPFYVWTLLAAALCWPPLAEAAPPAGNRRFAIPWPTICVGLGLTAWLQAGFGGMMIPSFAGVLAMCLALALAGRVRLKTVALRAAGGALLALWLNASKIYESVSFLRNFPRDFYGMPGFVSLGDALSVSVLAIIQPSQWTAHFGARFLSNVRFSVLPHEWALNFGFGALGVALAALAFLASSRRDATPLVHPNRISKSTWAAPCGIVRALILAALGLCLLVPPLLMWNDGIARAFIQHVPVLNSTAWPMRWIVIYLPLAQFALAWPIARLLRAQSPHRTVAIVLAAVTFAWVGPAMEPSDYYLSDAVQSYDPKPAIIAHAHAHAHARASGPVGINRIVLPREGESGANRNDAMFAGASQAACYNPIYGYRLESFPQPERVREGPALASDGTGQSLIFNPACLVHPQENTCRPGDGFRLGDPAQAGNAEAFLQRKPWEWQRPALGRAFSVATLLGWFAIGLLFATSGGLWLLRRLRRFRGR